MPDERRLRLRDITDDASIEHLRRRIEAVATADHVVACSDEAFTVLSELMMPPCRSQLINNRRYLLFDTYVILEPFGGALDA